MSVGETFPQSPADGEFDLDGFLEQEGGNDENRFASTIQQKQEQYGDSNAAIAELIEWYGGQQFYYPPYVGTISDIINQCPAINAQLMQGPDAVKSFLSGYEISDEEADEMRKKATADEEVEPDEEKASEDNKEQTEVAEATKEPAAVESAKSQQASDKAESVESLSAPEMALQETQSAPLPDQSSSRKIEDEDSIDNVPKNEDTKIEVAREIELGTVTNEIQTSGGGSRSIPAAKVVEQQKSNDQVEGEDIQASREPETAEIEKPKLEEIREVIPPEKEVDLVTPDETYPTPLPLFDVIDHEHVIERASTAEIIEALTSEDRNERELEDVEVFQLPQVYVPENREMSDDHIIESIDEHEETGSDATELEEAAVYTVDEAEPPHTMKESAIDNFEQRDDEQKEEQKLEPVLEETSELIATVVEYTGELPIEPVKEHPETLRTYADGAIWAIDTLEQAQTAEQCHERIEVLQLELAQLLEALGYSHSAEVAERLIGRYDTKTLRQFIATLIKAVTAAEAATHSAPVQHHRHHTFGRNVVSMLVHAVPFTRQLQTA